MANRWHGRAGVLFGRGGRAIIGAALIGLALNIAAGLAFGGARAAPREVRVLHWNDYVAPPALERFTKETGIKVILDTVDSNEMIDAKLSAGRTGYDLVVPTNNFVSRQVKTGRYQRVDPSRLKGYGNLWSFVIARMQSVDPGLQYTVPYMWGSVGLGINTAKVRKELGPAADLSSLSLLFDPANAAKLAGCGIHVLDSPEDIVPVALNYLGLDPNSRDQADLDKADALLKKLRPHVRKFHSSEYITALATGNICVAIGYSGDVLQAQSRALEAKNKIGIEFHVPREGSVVFIDSYAVPKDARNVAEAYEFLDFMLRPDVAALNTDHVHYASANEPARALVSPEIRNDPNVYPPTDVLGRLFAVKPFEQADQRSLNRLWTRIKTGR